MSVPLPSGVARRPVIRARCSAGGRGAPVARCFPEKTGGRFFGHQKNSSSSPEEEEESSALCKAIPANPIARSMVRYYKHILMIRSMTMIPAPTSRGRVRVPPAHGSIAGFTCTGKRKKAKTAERSGGNEVEKRLVNLRKSRLRQKCQAVSEHCVLLRADERKRPVGPGRC